LIQGQHQRQHEKAFRLGGVPEVEVVSQKEQEKGSAEQPGHPSAIQAPAQPAERHGGAGQKEQFQHPHPPHVLSKETESRAEGEENPRGLEIPGIGVGHASPAHGFGDHRVHTMVPGKGVVEQGGEQQQREKDQARDAEQSGDPGCAGRHQIPRKWWMALIFNSAAF